MKSLIALLLILTFVAANSYSQDTTYYDSKWKETTKEKSTYYRVDKKKGDMLVRTDYYSKNNQVQMQGNFSSFDPEIKDGYFIYFHQNGNLKHVGDYVQNKEAGEHLWYYENGNKEAIETHENGVLNGRYIEYYKDGKVSTETEFKSGKQHGLTKYFREDGSLYSEGQFKDGELNGVWKYYDEKEKLIGTEEYKTEYIIEEANMYLKLPNTDWRLDTYNSGDVTEYIFKRKVITDKDGEDIIPAIMIYIEDASNYEDVKVYSIYKQRPFIQQGVEIDEILIQENPDYPLSYKNSYWYKSHYNDGKFDHILYMVHIIDKENRGIQIYMDMTSSVADTCEKEFISTLKSIKKVN